MKSMTGYGTVHFESEKLSLTVTLKSVNGRYLDIRPHVPRQYQSFESEIKKMIAAEVQRGTVDLYIHRRILNATVGDVVINKKMAKTWKKAYQELAESLGTEDVQWNLEIMAALPDVVSVEESLSIGASEKKQVLKTLKEAITALGKERDREGKALKAELQSQLKQLKDLVNLVKEQAVSVNKDLKKKMMERLDSLGVDVDPQRLAQEVAIYLDKSDVREEISRLEEHIAMFQKLVNPDSAAVPSGKKMDFYCQELLREVNTIGSKSSQAKLTQTVVNAKSVIEKLREQVQNVE